ncbi:hypothetical protein ANO11243_064890 [Dothideomycetidae sp. 11243]|nr:hypothetical protein ANO11243_064890 [fungal sp. No.11243]
MPAPLYDRELLVEDVKPIMRAPKSRCARDKNPDHSRLDADRSWLIRRQRPESYINHPLYLQGSDNDGSASSHAMSHSNTRVKIGQGVRIYRTGIDSGVTEEHADSAHCSSTVVKARTAAVKGQSGFFEMGDTKLPIGPKWLPSRGGSWRPARVPASCLLACSPVCLLSASFLPLFCLLRSCWPALCCTPCTLVVLRPTCAHCSGRINALAIRRPHNLRPRRVVIDFPAVTGTRELR